MKNFDLKKYLAEGKLLKEETTYQFSEYDYSPEDDKEFIDRVYYLINTILGEDTPDKSKVESSIESTSDSHYSEARSENKKGREYEPISAESFAESVIENLIDSYLENWKDYENFDVYSIK